MIRKPLVSSEARSPELVDKSSKEYLIRTSGSDNEKIRLMAIVARHFGWERVSAVAPDDSIGALFVI